MNCYIFKSFYIALIIGFLLPSISLAMELTKNAISSVATAVKENPLRASIEFSKFATPAAGAFGYLQGRNNNVAENAGKATVAGAVGWGLSTAAEQVWKNPALIKYGLPVWLACRYGLMYRHNTIIEDIEKNKLRFTSDDEPYEPVGKPVFKNKIYNWLVCSQQEGHKDGKDYFSTSHKLNKWVQKNVSQNTQKENERNLVNKLKVHIKDNMKKNTDDVKNIIDEEIAELNSYINRVASLVPGGRTKIEHALSDALKSIGNEDESEDEESGKNVYTPRLRDYNINKKQKSAITFNKRENAISWWWVQGLLNSHFVRGMDKAWKWFLTLYPRQATNIERYFGCDKDPTFKEKVAEWADTYSFRDKLLLGTTALYPSRGEAFALCIDLLDRIQRLEILKEIVERNQADREWQRPILYQ